MLNIRTFDARQGGNVLYKALAHPLAAEAIAALYARLSASGPVAVFDPDDVIEALFTMHPDAPGVSTLFVQDVQAIGRMRAGLPGRPLTDLPGCGARSVLVAAFDAERIVARIRHLLPPGAEVATLDDARLPSALLTNPRRYLDRLNFATNYAFFREEGGLSTRLVTANYWAGYGAGAVRLWLRLFDRDGRVLATWEEAVPSGPGGLAIDSAAVRARFGLPEFTGQLFVHAVGAAGHDVVKYALDTYGSGNDASLSCTHDANAWPSDRYAGVPAPADGERVVLWVQNSHAVPIPAGGIALDRMGAETPVAMPRPVAPYATVALDVAELLPGLRWPAQIEVRAGRHFVRPRYEVVRGGRTRIAHANVERADLQPDPNLPALPTPLGRGFLLPVPVLPRGRFRTLIQPTPMAVSQTTLPVRLDVFDPEGRKLAERFLGCLPRAHDVAVDVDTLLPDGALAEGGHVDLVYDFRDGGSGDGWLHTLVRAEDRTSGHVAESSFGAHIYNTPMTYRDEPQSYAGPPPGLSTRLFLKLGDAAQRSFTALIYPSSAAWHPHSDTTLLLHDGDGRVIAEAKLAIACSGSALVFPHKVFAAAALAAAGPRGYVLIRDVTCRLFGYHGLMDDHGRFSLDHMFGF
ncbi:hypothetical protein [Limobrevibacterium gyesilva]|uniref:Uncharacterized protein n=1 Tax=Limobrevibacterium gyesilva TaxID=2991712 RepID=A0AA41YL95_9PROT|nr:hypothetical protein [Limobrevibacterium gyesilva]MCW3475934.1 hypothetical protein [Limobrevibacterium gyesilva]